MASLVPKSPMVKILGQRGIEGFEYDFYIPTTNGVPAAKSGATIANGIDMAAQNREKLEKLGVPEVILDKLDKMNLYGLRGSQAERAINNLNITLIPSEVNLLANILTEDSSKQAQKRIGKLKWAKLSDNLKAVATSLYHIYDRKWFTHDSFTQFTEERWLDLKANMEDYKDKTPVYAKGINNRHRRMSKYVPSNKLGIP